MEHTGHFNVNQKSSQTEMMNANEAGHMQEEAHPKTTLK